MSLERYIPSYSLVIRSLLEKGELYKEWDKMIEETAYYVLSVGNFETKEYIPTFEDLCIQSFHALVTQPLKILG